MTTRRVKGKTKSAQKNPQRGGAGSSSPRSRLSGKGRQQEGVKLVTYQCLVCGSKVRVSEDATLVVCWNRHKEQVMDR